MQDAAIAVGALWRREILKFVQDRSRLFGALAQPIGFWLLLGMGFGSTFQMPATDAPGYLEFLFPGILVLVLLFTAIFSTIYIVEDRKTGFLQAGLVAPIPRSTLMFGNILGGTTLAMIQATLFLVAAPFAGIVPSLAGLLLVYLAGFCTAVAFTCLGFVIAWRMESTRGFHAVMNLFLLPMWILSGAFFPREGSHVILQYLMAVNPVSYGVEAIRAALYWPASAPGAEWALWPSLAIIGAFAAIMLLLASRVVRRPVFGS